MSVYPDFVFEGLGWEAEQLERKLLGRKVLKARSPAGDAIYMVVPLFETIYELRKFVEQQLIEEQEKVLGALAKVNEALKELEPLWSRYTDNLECKPAEFLDGMAEGLFEVSSRAEQLMEQVNWLRDRVAAAE